METNIIDFINRERAERLEEEIKKEKRKQMKGKNNWHYKDLPKKEFNLSEKINKYET